MHVEVYSEKIFLAEHSQSVSVAPNIIFVVQLIGFFPSKNKVSCQHHKTIIAFFDTKYMQVLLFPKNFKAQAQLFVTDEPSFYIGEIVGSMLFGSIQIYDYFDICFDRVVRAKSCVYIILGTYTYMEPNSITYKSIAHLCI